MLKCTDNNWKEQVVSIPFSMNKSLNPNFEQKNKIVKSQKTDTLWFPYQNLIKLNYNH